MIRATSKCSDRSKRGERFKGALKRLRVWAVDSESPGWKLQVLDLKTKLGLGPNC